MEWRQLIQTKDNKQNFNSVNIEGEGNEWPFSWLQSFQAMRWQSLLKVTDTQYVTHSPKQKFSKTDYISSAIYHFTKVSFQFEYSPNDLLKYAKFTETVCLEIRKRMRREREREEKYFSTAKYSKMNKIFWSSRTHQLFLLLTEESGGDAPCSFILNEWIN